jgi:sugar phosphate isomerase/epimerase
MKTIKGPAIFLAQFAGDEAPFNNIDAISDWAASLGYKGIQIPTWDARLIDLQKVAESKTYADEYRGKIEEKGLKITELSTHLQGQLVAVHPAYDVMFDGFAPEEVHGKPKERQKWATNQLKICCQASANLGLNAHASFSGALMWHTVYPWPQRPAGLVEDGFKELARLWKPILDEFDKHGVDVCYELHPGEDLHDGITYEKFLEATGNHPRARILYDPSHFLLQQLDYLAFIDIYKDYIKSFHVKDAEFNPTGKAGVYGGYASWTDRPGRFRSLGDGQIDFGGIFTKLSQYDIDCWAVLEWECCIKHPEQGAEEGSTLYPGSHYPRNRKSV